MKVFKGVFPYILTAGMMVMPSCAKRPPVPEHKAVVKVISKEEPCWYYCDKDGDSLVDFRLFINEYLRVSSTRGFLKEHIQVGDTLVFRTFPEDLTARNIEIYDTDLKSVNNRSVKDILQIEELKKLRNMAAQEKVR